MILDNRDNGRVLDALKKAIGKGDKLNIITRKLSLFGYSAISEELNQVESVKLLISLKDMFPEELEGLPPILGDVNDRELRNELTVQALAKQFDEWLNDKVEVKGSYDPLNANHYEVFQDGGEHSVINGSSTLTSSGLGVIPSSGHEMNSLFEDDDNVLRLNNWFQQIWNNTGSGKEAMELLSDSLKSIYKPRSPQKLYFQTLYHLFKDSLDLIDEERVMKTRTGIKNTLVWNKLYKFQIDGVISAISKIEQHNGCIIADSVGLGKTFEALAVIKYYELRNDRVLVLAPKKLRDNWTIYTLNDKRNLFAEDRFNYDVLNHTDLTRDGGMSGDINLETVNWGTYDLIVIDESHNFRNNPPKKDGVTRYGKLMHQIIKSGVKTKVLMLSATPVNNRMNDLKNQVAFITEGSDDALYESGIHSIEQTLKKAQTKFNQWQNFEAEQRTTESLLDALNFDYFKLLDLLTIARSRKHITKYFKGEDFGTFPERLKPINKKPDIDLKNEFPPLKEINREIRKLNLAAYAPLKYLLPEKRDEYAQKYDTQVAQGSVFKQVDREQSLIHLMRVNLLKRLESSVVSFSSTLGKLHEKVQDLIDKIDSVDEIDELSIEDVDLEDESMEPFLIGNKIKVLIQDMDLIRWKEELQEDEEKLLKLYRTANSVKTENDAKLKELKTLLREKAENPINAGNKKALIFTAFTDTAEYLYDDISKWAKDELGLHVALVTGGNSGNKCTLPGIRTDLASIITWFSPISKERMKIDEEATKEIDIVIATDCISEGQNLQDCDFVVNYDIHWNPVRIIQRFGRVDRLGSINSKIQLVNFWPNLELDEYINLEARVSGRMVLLDISATGEENVIEYKDSATMNDLEYRRRQMEQLQDEVLDLEDLGSGISITDLTLNDFRMDLAEYLKNHEEELTKLPIGGRACVNPDEFITENSAAGVLFCLKSDNPNISIDPNYSIAPYYLAYVDADGNAAIPFTKTKKLLDIFKLLSLGNTSSENDAFKTFMKQTEDGTRMEKYQALLEKAVKSISGKAEEKGVESLFTRGGTTISKHSFKGVNDFEVVSYLIVSPDQI
ncbi:helicase-related protein [Rhodohalobacter mucosus]|uniref:Helicase n=1 Tax=Rhodohalobacter mucosus TaxID=2079485 RepID=A0A316TR05_9BACT|nr:helicase-related protein [Rhodohalobacter mucosus]PWN06121.1 helicase [Rhodohalobacter mucosus]